MKHVKKAVMLGLIATSTFLSLSAQNGVLSFDGVDDYFKLDTFMNHSRTIEFWFSPADEINAQTASFTPLVVRDHGPKNYDEVTINFNAKHVSNPGHLVFKISKDVNTTYTVVSDSSIWRANTWYHVAAVIDPTDGMKLFINGVKQKSTNSYNKPVVRILKPTCVGSWGDSLSLPRYFEGLIDDIHFANTALYSTKFTPPCPDRKAVSSTLGLWNLNKSSTTWATDSSGNSYSGSINGASRSTAEICGAQKNSIRFDGVDDYVNLDTSINNARTIEFWFMPSTDINAQTSTFIPLVVRDNGPKNYDEFAINFNPKHVSNPGHLSFKITQSVGVSYNIISDSSEWRANTWYHVAAVIDPTDGMKLFIDGVKQKNTNTYNKKISRITKPTCVGSWGDSLSLPRYFPGLVDDIHFASGALYTSNFTPPCPDRKAVSSTLGLWNFNGNSVTIATDSSAGSNHGTINGATRVTSVVCDPNASTGLALDLKYEMIVYPNPSNGKFTFEFENKSNVERNIEIFNGLGQSAYSGNSSEWSQTIDLSNLSKGLYHYRVVDGNAVYTGNLIKR